MLRTYQPKKLHRHATDVKFWRVAEQRAEHV